MKLIPFLVATAPLSAVLTFAQPTPEPRSDVSGKALLADADAAKFATQRAEAVALRKLADNYYAWRNEQYPVRSSDSGLHTWDDRLTDFSAARIKERAQHVQTLLAKVRAMETTAWPKNDRIDWILFRAQLERVAFADRILKSEEKNPQVYVEDCANGIFSLLKKEYAKPHTRALAATARLKQMPALLEQGLKNLREPVKLYAQLAIASARSSDSLFTDSLMTLAAELPAAEKDALVQARDAALAALHSYADALEKRLPEMVDFAPMGEANYNYYLKHVLLLPLDATQVEMLGRAELARYRALEAMLADPAMADPDPARSKSIPPDQESFLKAYESRQVEMIDFLKKHRLITLPEYLGPFQIRQLPEAFKPTSPGGFMNPPGVYDKDPSGFYLHPDLQSGVEEFLHSRRNRRSASHPRARRNPGPFPAAFHRQSRLERNPAPA